MAAPTIVKSAHLSDCGTYRYTLYRAWADDKAPLVWLMLNPSTADATVDDPTVRRILGFTLREGIYGGIVVANLYALRSAYPTDLAKHRDPIGPLNDQYLADLGGSGWDIVAAWGAHAALRSAQVLMGPLRDRSLLCLGKTKGGYPKHPLYIKADQPFEEYR